MKVVIPAAGLGVRFLPATKSMPKEMLPVVDRPIIQYVVEEAVAAGADDIIIITGRNKRAVEDHFDYHPELGDHPALKDLDVLTQKADLFFVRQRRPRGLGDAILCAQRHVGDEAFGVLLGDTINVCPVPLLRQLYDRFIELGAKSGVVAVEEVPDAKVSDYGIVGVKKLKPGVMEIGTIIEKPSIAQAPSRFGLTGAYWLTPTIFDCLRRTPPGKNGEIQLSDAMALLLEIEKIYAVTFQGIRYDIGDRSLWLKANMEFAARDLGMRDRLRAALREGPP